MEKGVGEYQINKARSSAKQIIEILSDGKWHRYQEIKEATRLSTATLSKHLKRLEQGLIERRVDTKVYPPHVYYRLKPYVVITHEGKIERAFAQEFLKTSLDASLNEKKLEIFLRNLAFWVVGEISANLAAYLLHDVSDEWLEQANQYFLFEPLHEIIETFKESLKKMGKKEAHKLLVYGTIRIMLEHKEASARDEAITETMRNLWEMLSPELKQKLKEELQKYEQPKPEPKQ